MGCGASVENDNDPTEAPQPKTTPQKNDTQAIANSNDVKSKSETRTSPDRKKPLANDVLPPIANVPRAVAFDVSLDNNIDHILSKQPPKRLKRLQPIENAPKLTSEQLEEKLRLAEENRSQELEKRKLVSRKSSSKLRQNLQRAQEFEKTNQVQHAEELEEKLRSAGKNREEKLREAEEKKRIREERRRKTLERGKLLKAEKNDLEFDVEKDENFNTVEDDSWMEDGDRATRGDNVYSGRQSPHKQAGRPVMEYRGLSASTTDSFDHAFQRQGPTTIDTSQSNGFHNDGHVRDDFFDS